jgi:Mg-chelatase subunit ChlD
MRACSLLFAALALFGNLSVTAYADTRTDNIDVIIALDKSLSMEHKVDAVKAWVNSYLIDQLLIKGDYFIVVGFYGKTEVLISQELTGDADRMAFKKTISQIRGNGRFTDIGNALDAVKEQAAIREKDGREKYVLLLTDGIQEAPPTSRYYSKDGKFNHEFLANTKTIQEKGWKIMILGIGTDTAAKDLAKELQGSYGEITSKLTLDSLSEKAGELLGAIAVEGPVRIGPIGSDGASQLTFTVRSKGLAGDATIFLSGVTVATADRSFGGLIVAPRSLAVKKDSSTPVSIPLRFPRDLPKGPTPATVSFSFASAARFTPSEAPVELSRKGWIAERLVVLAAGLAAVLALAAVAFVLIWRLTRGKPIRFAVLISDAPIEGSPFSLAPGRQLYLTERSGAFTLVPKRTARSLARFEVKSRALRLAVLKQDRFPKLKEAPDEARGHSFVLRTENGRSVPLKIQSKERKR